MGNLAPVAVVGLGRSGVAAVEFLARQGVSVLACDQRAAPWAVEAIRAVTGPVQFFPDHIPGEMLSHCREILLSPGIPRSHAALAAALQAGIPVTNDVEWLYRATRTQRPLIIGITGTNGKSTVTTMVGLMMDTTGRPSRTGGNLGQAALSLWGEQVEIYVLELSSFQLESIDQFQADVAAVINLTPDHMDRYPDPHAYLNAKLRLLDTLSPTGRAILMVDDPVLDQVRRERYPNAVAISMTQAIPGGVYLQEGMLVDHLGPEAIPILPAAEILADGWHNRINAAVAAAVALCGGVERAQVARVLRTFTGLPHRMERIRTLNGVTWYNDSKGTNVGAVLQSLNSFAHGVVLIAGGRDKHSDFTPLAPLVKDRCRAVILLGEAADALQQALAATVPLLRADSMAQAVELARTTACSGDVVLLSPACASFDMFANFEDRGDRFRAAVLHLSNSRG